MLVPKKNGQSNIIYLIIGIFGKKLTMGHNTTADVSASVSLLSAAVSITTIQPYISLLASLIGVCSGLFAIRHYYYKHKERKQRGNS